MKRIAKTLVLAMISAGPLTVAAGMVRPSMTADAAGDCSALSVGNRNNYEGDVIYQVLTDRFADGNPANNNPYGKPNAYDPARTDINRYFGGDWQGLAQKMPYLAGMGIGAVWISPPYNNLDDAYLENGNYYNGYHGFWAKDYFVPDEHWGSWADFDALVEAAHAHGIKVIIDFAPNHTNHVDSVENAGFYRDGLLVGRYSSDTQGYFHHLGERGNDQTSDYDFQYRDLTKLADLSTENDAVQRYLTDAMSTWLAHGVDGIRNDATLHQTEAFRTVFADEINRQGGAFHFGEYFIGSPDPKYDDYRTSPEATGINILDFEFANISRDVFGSFSKDMNDLSHMLEYTAADYKYENDAVTWLDSHDKSRLASIQGNQGVLHSALAFLLTSRGTPVIYYGTEQYMTGSNGDAGRKWMGSFDTTTPAYQMIRKLADLRAENPALRYGGTTTRWVNQDVLVVQRKFYGSVVVVALNRSGATYNLTGLTTDLPAGTHQDVLTGTHSGGPLVANADGSVATYELGPSEIGVWSYVEPVGGNPKVGAVGPTQGAPGYSVSIDGSAFGMPGTVTVGGVAAAIECWSDDQIIFTVPAVGSGEQPVVVQNDMGQSNSFAYKVKTGSQTQVIVHANVTTVPGEQIYLVGNVAELGAWDPAEAVGPFFNPEYPEWFLPVSMPGGEQVEFKLIKKSSDGTVTWEGGNNRTYLVPNTGATDSPVYTWQP
ncbi:alpha-amylase family glycosyl hydrolase [Ornithinimicrobium tianjinense]|uniref:Alpha-amylase n=1 Tax=Ornithinimicrobium tianjinense TaxID=1195761 RepID=A0A917BTJ4_9MICO|nr:alpha-amylase family glycosyl hydrolase [Ornithinimicrobium tianjinense]GGF56289.1 putative cyclomaltodextrin glucanotransferase [Ornithinimicrobium tianjinense]